MVYNPRLCREVDSSIASSNIRPRSRMHGSMQNTPMQPQLKLSPTVAYDPTTQSYAAWCDELAVATSGSTEEEARTALSSAIRMAAEYILGSVRSARSDMLASVPYAEAVASRSDEELEALINARV